MLETQPKYHNQLPTPELQRPRYDALLVHGYWLTDKTMVINGKNGIVSEKHVTAPSLRTHLATRAAALAWDHGRGAGKIIVDLGKLWGPNHPAEGKIIADSLVKKYHVPREAIILRQESFSTYGEIKTALELAKQNGWTKLLDVAFASHHLTIPGIYGSSELKGVAPEGLQVDYRSVESIIDHDDPRVISVRRKFAGMTKQGLKLGVGYLAYESLKWARMHFPGFKYQALEEKNKQIRTKPTEDSGLPWRFDKYTLPPKQKHK